MTSATDPTEPPADGAAAGDAPRASAPRRAKRERTATESLMTATMGMEIVVVLFGAIALFGTRATNPEWLAFAGGAALIVLLIVAIRLARYPWGYWVSGAIQVLLLATGFLEILAAVTAAIFVGFWIYSLVRGRQLDEAKRRYLAENPGAAESSGPTDHTDRPTDQENAS